MQLVETPLDPEREPAPKRPARRARITIGERTPEQTASIEVAGEPVAVEAAPKRRARKKTESAVEAAAPSASAVTAAADPVAEPVAVAAP
jgi:hypothetical protein